MKTDVPHFRDTAGVEPAHIEFPIIGMHCAVCAGTIEAALRKVHEVIGASINKTGSFKFKATKVGKDTMLSQIIRLVQDAQGSKAPIQRVVDAVSAYFVPTVIIITILSFMAWYTFGPVPAPAYAVIVFVTVLIIACPCALGLATPTSLMVGVGKAAEQGILIKSGEALETAHKLNAVILDKTGTITKGTPAVTDVVVTGSVSEDELLRLAASVEKGSRLGEAIVQGAAARGLELTEAKPFEAVPGHGVKAEVGGRALVLGNLKMMAREHIDLGRLEQHAVRLADEGKTPNVRRRGRNRRGRRRRRRYREGGQQDSDRRAETHAYRVVMITGDNPRTATAIGRQVGVDRILAEVLPEDKAHQVQMLQLEGKTVGMVGDGINDAPALAQADVGMAIGSGTDVAIEAADVTLVRGSLMGVVTAIQLSRATMRNIRQNLFGAFVYNTLGLPVAAGLLYPFFGILLSPLMAAAAMAASSVTVVTNANRMRKWSPQP